MLVFPRDSVNANQLLYDVARFNFSSFVVRDFDLEPMSFGNVGLLIVKGFENLRQLEHYRSVRDASQYRIPDGVRPVMISKRNFELLLTEGRSFEEYFRFEEEENYTETEEKVLEGAEEAEEAEEAPEAEPEAELGPVPPTEPEPQPEPGPAPPSETEPESTPEN